MRIWHYDQIHNCQRITSYWDGFEPGDLYSADRHGKSDWFLFKGGTSAHDLSTLPNYGEIENARWRRVDTKHPVIAGDTIYRFIDGAWQPIAEQPDHYGGW